MQMKVDCKRYLLWIVYSKYGIYADKTDSADVFKLSNRQEIPIFVSEKFKDLIQKVNITGISLTEISVV